MNLPNQEPPTPQSICLPDIRNETRATLTAQFAVWNEPSYRLDQLLDWLYVRRAGSWDAMTNLSKSLRSQLASTWSLGSLGLVRKQGSRDSTQKFLWRLKDGALIESVLIPANPALYGEAADRHTLCVSTQVGCAYGCRFCASGLDEAKPFALGNYRSDPRDRMLARPTAPVLRGANPRQVRQPPTG